MKTNKFNTGNLTKRMSIILIALMFGTGLFAQKSVLSFEFQQFTKNFIGNTEAILTAMSFSDEEVIVEEEIEFEDWMIDLEKWAEKMDTVSKAKSSEEMKSIEDNFVEDQLELENWMMQPDWMNSDNEHTSKELESSIDEELQIENWMSNPEEWLVAKNN